ncbi:MAG TPA: GreA/GreB family elongation factor [Terricaulis sp.]|nr:GreA/GreB family elongation factor [Terricaulis sp.]
MIKNTRPKITVSRDDHEELIDLALKGLGRAPGAAFLLQEMQRAKAVDSSALLSNVLSMNDNVAFEYDGASYKDYQLVYPNCANFADGRISVLTPVGAALIGLGENDEITWPNDRGGEHRLKLTAVSRAR